MVQNLLIQSINAVSEYTFGNYTDTKSAYSNLKFKHTIELVDTKDQCFTKLNLNIQGDPVIIGGYLQAEIMESLKYLKETITKYDDGGDITYDEIPSAMDQITQIAALAHSEGYFQDDKWETIKNAILYFYHWYQENFFEEITIPDDKVFKDLNFDDLIEQEMLQIFYPSIDNRFWVPEYMQLPLFLLLKEKLEKRYSSELSYLGSLTSSCFEETEYWSNQISDIQNINMIISYIGDEILGNQLNGDEDRKGHLIIYPTIDKVIQNSLIFKAYLEYLITQNFEGSPYKLEFINLNSKLEYDEY